MPVSRKRKPKAAPPPIPTRRQREAYYAGTPADDRDANLAAANATVEHGLSRDMDRLRIADAHSALAQSPLCTEAYIVLAQEARADEDARDLFQRGIHAAELILGPEAFARHAGSFGATPETQPYMAARYGLAQTLLDLDQDDEAIAHLQAMLVLNPKDDQGVRNTLLAVLLDQHDPAEARALLASRADEQGTTWLYGRLLMAYRDEHHTGPATTALAVAAFAANAHVSSVIAGTTPDAETEYGPSQPGSPEEATDYAIAFEKAWVDTPGAVEWLQDLQARHSYGFP